MNIRKKFKKKWNLGESNMNNILGECETWNLNKILYFELKFFIIICSLILDSLWSKTLLFNEYS